MTYHTSRVFVLQPLAAVPLPAMTYQLVLELVHHFFIARNLFPPNVYNRIIELGSWRLCA